MLRLIAILSCLLTAGIASAQDRQLPDKFVRGDRAAIVIGLNYASAPERWQLRNAEADALAVSRKLRSIGFDVTTVTDAEIASAEDLRSAVDAFASSSRGHLKLVYFAGHGIQSGGSNILVAGGLGEETISGLTAGSILEKLGAQNDPILFFLDACRNNPLDAPSSTGEGQRSAFNIFESQGQIPRIQIAKVSADNPVPPGLAKLNSALAREALIMYATAPGRTASDGAAADRNSPFARALIGAIDDRAEIIAVAKKIVTDTQELTRDNPQRPWITLQLSRDIFLTGEPAPQTVVPIDLPG